MASPRFNRISAFRQRITIQRDTVVDLGGGSWDEGVPEDIAEVGAHLRQMTGEEGLGARQLEAGTPYEVTVRAPLPDGVDLKASDRIIWASYTGDRTLELTSPPALDSSQRYLRFLAVEKEEVEDE